MKAIVNVNGYPKAIEADIVLSALRDLGLRWEDRAKLFFDTDENTVVAL